MGRFLCPRNNKLGINLKFSRFRPYVLNFKKVVGVQVHVIKLLRKFFAEYVKLSARQRGIDHRSLAPCSSYIKDIEWPARAK